MNSTAYTALLDEVARMTMALMRHLPDSRLPTPDLFYGKTISSR